MAVEPTDQILTATSCTVRATPGGMDVLAYQLRDGGRLVFFLEDVPVLLTDLAKLADPAVYRMTRAALTKARVSV